MKVKEYLREKTNFSISKTFKFYSYSAQVLRNNRFDKLNYD